MHPAGHSSDAATDLLICCSRYLLLQTYSQAFKCISQDMACPEHVERFNQAELGCHVRVWAGFLLQGCHGQGIICSEFCPQVSPQWWGGCPALQQQRQGVMFCHTPGALGTWLILGNNKFAVLTDLLKLLPLLIVEVVQVLVKLHTRHSTGTAADKQGMHVRAGSEIGISCVACTAQAGPWRDSPGSADRAPQQAAPLFTTSLAICRACSRLVERLLRRVPTEDSQAG